MEGPPLFHATGARRRSLRSHSVCCRGAVKIRSFVVTTQKSAAGMAKSNEPYLKGKNSVYLWSLEAVNAAVLVSLVASHFDSSSMTRSWATVSAKSGMIAVGAPPAAKSYARENRVMLFTTCANVRHPYWGDPDRSIAMQRNKAASAGLSTNVFVIELLLCIVPLAQWRKG